MYSLYPVTMDRETLDTEAMERQSVEKLSTDTPVEGNSTDRQMTDGEQIVDAEPGITVVSGAIQCTDN